MTKVLEAQGFDLKVALVCIAKWEDTIEEWYKYHLKLGFDKVYVYQNNWACEVKHNDVIIIDFPGEVQQLNAYNHFLNTYRKDYDWVAFFDVDEYLVLKKHNNVKSFIIEYNNPYGIAVNWVYFGDKNQKNINGDKNSFISRFFTRTEMNTHIKSILNLKCDNTMILPHNPNTKMMDTTRKFFSGPFNPTGSVDVVQLNHYYYKSLEEWTRVCEKGRADTNNNTKLVNNWELHTDYIIEDKLAYNFYYEK